MRLAPLLLLLAILVLPLGGVALGTDRSAARVVGQDDHSITLEIVAPQAGLSGRHARRVGSRPILEIPAGYGRDRRGTPSDLSDDLALRRERIALPFGADASLEILEVRTSTLPGARRTSAGPSEPLPSHLRLGAPGQMRFLRYVPLEVRPVVPTAEGGWSRLEGARVKVRFEGGEGSSAGAATSSAAASSSSDLFAPLYERGVLNPEQGRRFRRPFRPPSNRPVFRPFAVGERRVRLDVLDEGIHTVTPDWLRAQGIDVPAGGVPSSDLRMTFEGDETAIAVLDGGDGSWGDGPAGAEAVLFYGFPRLGEEEPGVWEGGDFTDTNVFWLDVQPGARLRIEERPSEGGSPPLLESFPWTVHVEEDEFLLGQSVGVGKTHWFSPMVRSADGRPDNLHRERIFLPGLAPGDGLLAWSVLGRLYNDGCEPDHVAVLCVGGDDADCTPGGATALAEPTWDGLTIHQGEAPIPAASLSNPVEVRLLVPETDPRRCQANDIHAPDWFEVTYPRAPAATGDGLVLTPEEGSWRFEVSGFSDPAVVATWDVSAPLAPQAIVPESAAGDTVAFQATAPAGARYVLAGPTALLTPSSAREEAGLDLRDPTREVDYLAIVAGEIAADPAGAQALTDLLSMRAGFGAVESITIEAVLDQFGEGRYDPRALQSFLRHALESWARPPQAVVLIGEATIDMKDNLGIGGAQVPTFLFDNPAFTELGWYGSDTRLAAVLGADPVPDLLLGRLPVRTGQELADLVAKIDAYETTAPGEPSLGWRSRLVMSADLPEDAAEEINFEGSHDTVAADLAGTPYDVRKRYFRDWSPDHLGYRDMIVGELTDGALVWSYAGHGNHAKLSNAGTGIFATIRADGVEFVQPGDLRDVANGTALPLLVHANCLTGQFMVTGLVESNPDPDVDELVPLEAMAELFVEKPDGGAVAAIAPAGLTFVGQTGDLVEGAYDLLIQDKGDRLVGTLWYDMLLRLDAISANLEVDQTVLIGDPLTRLAVPGPSAVENLAASPGNAVVDLTWDAVPEPSVTYELQRASIVNPNWSTLDSTTQTSYTDDTVRNARTYFYRIRAHDADGFPGPLSPWVEARPENPDPPAPPQDVTAVVEGPLTIRVDWTPNAESDLSRYTVHYGASPDDPRLPGPGYSEAEDFPIFGTPPARLDPVDTERPTYLCVTATNTSGRTSACSNEVRVGGPAPTPTAAPFLPHLEVRREGEDVVLDWRHVVHDVWGRDKADVDRYEIYRSTSPFFSMRETAPVDVVSCACAEELSWRDAGALAGDCEASGTCLVFYAAPAVDVQGETSSIAGDLPRRPENVQAQPDGPGTRVTWDAVDRDLRGVSTAVVAYRVYGSDIEADVSRESLRGSGDVFLLAEVDGGITWALVDSYAFYTVVAVDSRGAWSP